MDCKAGPISYDMLKIYLVNVRIMLSINHN